MDEAHRTGAGCLFSATQRVCSGHLFVFSRGFVLGWFAGINDQFVYILGNLVTQSPLKRVIMKNPNKTNLVLGPLICEEVGGAKGEFL